VKDFEKKTIEGLIEGFKELSDVFNILQ